MALPLYLALTAAEMAGNPLPPAPAYLSCRFSPGGTGLSNFPPSLPAGAMLILDDSTPMDGHDPEFILKQLRNLAEQWHCSSILLDFQRPDIAAQQELAELLTASLPCPVGVSDIYAAGLSCPVFLSPVPPDMPLVEYLIPWQNREIWLEAALDGLELILSEDGCVSAPMRGFPEDGRADRALKCHYDIRLEDTARFRLWRTREDLNALLKEAENAGITRAVGLWQELGR